TPSSASSTPSAAHDGTPRLTAHSGTGRDLSAGRMRVVVVGGGVIGCATAWELRKAGCAVTLLERATPGAEASGAAAGMLAPVGESSAPGLGGLALASWRLYPAVVAELRERTGIDVEYVTRGTLYPLAEPPDARSVERWRRDAALPVEVLDAREARAREPALAPWVGGAIFVAGDHWVNNQRLVVAYAQAAAAAGVEVLTGHTVSRLVVEGDRVRGVVAEGRRFE